ncbi:hypothetical protein [Pseudobacteriovorax antillogorgiicola]|uniref:Uncharacterized protein n=1 Tax=Pseudobacteriovorax antillogorgiicola TaxID=1513793 RepID=A0A1Y6C0W3_9BACT|nr:hypothetical protein [Pseudobacteriovorax antillogorgiicola]TCS50652.1 hypothetical protein EDD56_11234 [Pseudobacteriovorax antillogorgiicola]SMF39716.1 hypothetical protein SAMN06296036_11233 [Pseudobacteriovorax antillogorgiicola]
MKYLFLVLLLSFEPAFGGDDDHNHDQADRGNKHSHDDHQSTDDHDHDHKNESDKHKHKDGKHSDEHDHKLEDVKHSDDHGHGDHGHKDDEHDHHGSSFGQGKAIEDVDDEGRKFKLSSQAIARLGIQEAAPKKVSKQQFEIPVAALLHSKEDYGVFLRSETWFTLISVELIKTSGGTVLIKASNITPQDRVVVAGVPLLRVAQLEAMGKGGQGHVH